MKTIQKSLLTASLLLASVTATAQNVIAQDLESWMETILCQADERKVEVSRNIGHERDVQKEGTPLKWRRDIITLTLPKKHRNLLDDMIRAFESNAQYNPKCYGVNSQRGASNGNASNSIRRMMYGDFPMDYVEIGKDYNNYINVNILDAKDTTKTHRYAYALEWREQNGTTEKGAVDVRYIVTYGRIPSNPSSSLEVIKKMKSNEDAIESYKQYIKRNDPKNVHRIGDARIPSRFLANGDSAFVVEEIGEPAWNTEVLPAMERGNYLLLFSNLKKQYKTQKNSEFTAISIYSLCKQAVEEGYFKGDSSEELNQLKSEVDKLIKDAKTETDRKYFMMALSQVEKILKSKK